MKTMLYELLYDIDRKKRLNPDGSDMIADVLEGKRVYPLPLIFWNARNASISGKTFNMREQFYDKNKMLYAQLEEIYDCADNAFEASLCVRPNFGTIFVPAMLGLEYKVFEDKFPWLERHLSKEEIKKIDLPDLDKAEMMNRAVEYIEFFKEVLPDWIHIYQPDTQGPFDIAHLIYGDNIFYDIYDDPDFVHSLMELSTELYIQVSLKLKKVIGEPNDSCYHGHALARGIYMRNGGVRVSEDTPTLLSPRHIEEFVVPYVKKALDAFGGGFIHFCGRNEHLLDAFLRMDGVRAVNLGNPEMYDFETTMEKFIHYKKCYFGIWPKKQGENMEQYINRMKKYSNAGSQYILLHFDERMFPEYSPMQIRERWQTG